MDHPTFQDMISLAKHTRTQLVDSLASITHARGHAIGLPMGRVHTVGRVHTRNLHKRYTRLIQRQRTSKDTVELIEKVIENIAKWKHDHPEEFHGLVEIEKKLVDLIKPGADGTWQTSKIVTDYKYLISIGVYKVITLAATFAAGAITMAYILGVFDSVKEDWFTASGETIQENL